MATNTPNYNLVKPSDSDLPDQSVLNGNMDKIDTAIKANATNIGLLGWSSYQSLPLNSGWDGQARVRRCEGLRIVEVTSGSLVPTAGVLVQGSVAFTLPSGYRPTFSVPLLVRVGGVERSGGYLVAYNDGTVVVTQTGVSGLSAGLGASFATYFPY